MIEGEKQRADCDGRRERGARASRTRCLASRQTHFSPARPMGASPHSRASRRQRANLENRGEVRRETPRTATGTVALPKPTTRLDRTPKNQGKSSQIKVNQAILKHFFMQNPACPFISDFSLSDFSLFLSVKPSQGESSQYFSCRSPVSLQVNSMQVIHYEDFTV